MRGIAPSIEHVAVRVEKLLQNLNGFGFNFAASQQGGTTTIQPIIVTFMMFGML